MQQHAQGGPWLSQLLLLLLRPALPSGWLASLLPPNTCHTHRVFDGEHAVAVWVVVEQGLPNTGHILDLRSLCGGHRGLIFAVNDGSRYGRGLEESRRSVDEQASCATQSSVKPQIQTSLNARQAGTRHRWRE